MKPRRLLKICEEVGRSNRKVFSQCSIMRKELKRVCFREFKLRSFQKVDWKSRKRNLGHKDIPFGLMVFVKNFWRKNVSLGGERESKRKGRVGVTKTWSVSVEAKLVFILQNKKKNKKNSSRDGNNSKWENNIA